MGVFNLYARYYNLLYKEKDYAGEAEYVHKLIQKYQPGAKSILDLGCGTGRHDILLAEKGYSVTGVDRSEEMLAVANANLSASALTSTLIFLHGDIRSIRLRNQSDIVVSLFHVMSYQTSNDELNAAFASARANLKQGGVFIFDCWYGPAVLTDRPSVRMKQLEDEDIFVMRTAEPLMHPNENVVDVNYTVLIRDKASQRVDELKETHRMRYLFRPEVEFLLAENRLSLIEGVEWMTGREPGFDTWSVCFVAKA